MQDSGRERPPAPLQRPGGLVSPAHLARRLRRGGGAVSGRCMRGGVSRGADPARARLRGGNNASHLSEHYACTLSDISPQMLTLSQGLNPGCEHVLGDMRTVRLGRTFDIVFVHDAIAVHGHRDRSARLPRDGLRAPPPRRRRALRARPHAGVVPCPRPTTGATTGQTGGACAISSGHANRAAGRRDVRGGLRRARLGARRPTEIVHDHHVEGLFPVHTWLVPARAGRLRRGTARSRRAGRTAMRRSRCSSGCDRADRIGLYHRGRPGRLQSRHGPSRLLRRPLHPLRRRP